MMKWIGAFLLVLATTCIGIYVSNRFENRPKHIRQLKSALQLLEAEITYSQVPLQVAFQTIAKQLPYPVSQFFQDLSTKMQLENTDFYTLWNKGVEDLSKIGSFKNNEAEILKQFGISLGQHDFTQQQKQIRLALTHLDRELEEARDEHFKYSNLAKSLGVLSGVFLVLLLV